MRIIWVVGLVAVAFLTRFAFFGGKTETAYEGLRFEAPYELREASSEELAAAMPAWARATEETRLHVESGLPTPVLDPLNDLVYVLVPSGRYPIGALDERAPMSEHARVVSQDPESGKRQTGYWDVEHPFYVGREEVPMRCLRRHLGLVSDFVQDYPEDFPAVGMTFGEAKELAGALGGRVPSEAEWECAARGPFPENTWPWGPSEDAGDALIGPSIALTALEDLKPGGSSRRDRSWCGARDMAGSVAEWSVNEVTSHPTVRGGSVLATLGGSRTTSRRTARRTPMDDGFVWSFEQRVDFIGLRVLRQP